MIRAQHRKTPQADKGTNRRLAFAVFAPPLAWALHGLVGVTITGRSCHGGEGLANWQWAVLGTGTLAAAGVALAGFFTALRVFRNWEDNGKVAAAEGWDRVEFTALFAMFVSAFLLLGILYFGIMPLAVEPCLRTI